MQVIDKKLLDFLKELKLNNTKEWFDTNRNRYEELRKQYMVFVSELLNEMKKVEPSLQKLEPKNCVFRINRDIRFSNNKDPYKTNFGCYFNSGGKKINNAGFYIHIEPNNSFMAVGVWQPDNTSLAKIRQEIDYNLKDFKSILSNKKLKENLGEISFNDSLKTAPKGYDKNLEHIKYLCLKSFIITKPITNKELLDSQFQKNAVTAFKTAQAFVSFLNTAIDND
jgi:uncharacterized protein (TIGR02453 family)